MPCSVFFDLSSHSCSTVTLLVDEFYSLFTAARLLVFVSELVILFFMINHKDETD